MLLFLSWIVSLLEISPYVTVKYMTLWDWAYILECFVLYLCLYPVHSIYTLHVVVSFIGGGIRKTCRKSPTCRKSLTNIIT
jgi:hypothetical protein